MKPILSYVKAQQNATQLAQKAQQVDVNNALSLKADKTYVDTQKSRIDTLISTPNSSFYQKSTNGTTGALLVVSSGATTGQINLASVTPVATGYTPVAGDYVLLVYGLASGSAELIDGRTGADGVTYSTIGGAVRTQLTNIKNDLYTSVPVDTTLTANTDYEVHTGFGISGTNTVNSLYTKALVESQGTNNTVSILPVTPGQTYKVTGWTYYNVYNALGLIFSDTKWDFATYTTSNRINIISGNYDYYGGQTTNAWAQFVDYVVTVPTGANYLYVRGNAIIKRTTIQNTSKIPVQLSQLTNDNAKKKTVFPITNTPTATVGTVSNELYKTRYSTNAFRWDFNAVGTMTCPNVQFVTETNDTVGIWLYVNHNMLNQPDNLDGSMAIIIDGVQNKSFSLAYNLHAGWNYVLLNNIQAGKHNISLQFNFTLVRSNYTLIVDSIELNYKAKPKVLIAFDDFGTDGYNVRYPLLDQRGLRATFCNPIMQLTDAQIRELLMKGWDWSIYCDDTTTRPDWVTGTVDAWKTYLQAKINAHEARGLFNPIAYFSPNNRGSQLLMDAEKAVGFKMSRIACSGNYYMDYFTHDGFFIYTYGIGNTTVASDAINVLNQAIATGTSICFFSHQVQDTLTADYNCLTSVMTPILDAIKTARDNNQCDVITFREFYQLWEPSDYEHYMNQRREKEKNYILTKLGM